MSNSFGFSTSLFYGMQIFRDTPFLFFLRELALLFVFFPLLILFLLRFPPLIHYKANLSFSICFNKNYIFLPCFYFRNKLTLLRIFRSNGRKFWSCHGKVGFCLLNHLKFLFFGLSAQPVQ